MEQFRNQYGIPVIKMCASCEFKDEDNVHRYCTNGRGIVRKDDICPEWCVSHKLDVVGKGGGGVKKREYLYHVFRVNEEEEKKVLEAKESKRYYKKKEIKEIRRIIQ